MSAVGSDHRIVTCFAKISYRVNKKPSCDPMSKIDWKALSRNSDLRYDYAVEVNNRYSAPHWQKVTNLRTRFGGNSSSRRKFWKFGGNFWPVKALKSGSWLQKSSVQYHVHDELLDLNVYKFIINVTNCKVPNYLLFILSIVCRLVIFLKLLLKLYIIYQISL